MNHETFDLGDVALQSGATLQGMSLAYKTYGTLNAARDNVVVYPTFYSGTHADNEWLIGETMALDPRKYFIIVPNMFGNGVSSSPSNNPQPYDRGRFPNVTLYDNVAMQHRLVTEKFGVTTVNKNGRSGIVTTSGSSAGTDQIISSALTNSQTNANGSPFPVSLPTGTNAANRYNVNLPIASPAVWRSN